MTKKLKFEQIVLEHMFVICFSIFIKMYKLNYNHLNFNFYNFTLINKKIISFDQCLLPPFFPFPPFPPFLTFLCLKRF